MDLSVLKANLCLFCGLPRCNGCKCPFDYRSELISNIKEERKKRNIWVTIISGIITKEHFKSLKTGLGTGGTYFQNKILLRGQLLLRVIPYLEKLGYLILEKQRLLEEKNKELAFRKKRKWR